MISGNYYWQWTIGQKGVTKIIDDSFEYPDSTHFLFSVWDNNNNLIAKIINASVVVEYEQAKQAITKATKSED